MKLKVAYIIGNFPLLSETFVASEISRLKSLGMDVHIFAFAKPPSEDIEKLNASSKALMKETCYLSDSECMLSALQHPLLVMRGWGENAKIHKVSTLTPNRMLRLFRAIAVADSLKRLGITHLHAHWPYATQVAHLVHTITGMRYSISVHAHEVAHENGHFPIVFDKLSFAAFCNRGAMEYLLQKLPTEARKKCHLIYHGVDVQNFPVLDLPASNEPLYVISAGRLTRTKGFDRLIHACATARTQGMNVRLTILGRGAQELELRKIADEVNFSDYLEMPGWVAHDEVKNYMMKSHVFALLADTTFHDGLPNVALEAMSSGRPVILSPLPAAPEAVTDGAEGFILDSAVDIGGFVAAIRRLYDDRNIIRRMGDDARNRVVKDHDALAQIILMMRLFQEQDAARCI